MIKELWYWLNNRQYRQSHIDTLELHSQYFRNLDMANRKRFLGRLQVYLDHTDFVTEPGYRIESDIKVAIASAFIQLTFGLQKFIPREYQEIFVAPRPYTYRGMDKSLSGDVNTVLKRISLSWPCVERGFEIPDDALNIALHEFAHCIMIENISGPVPGLYFNRKDWNQLMLIGRNKISRMNNGEEMTLREYGGTNTMEFFAVSIEHFFERPEHCRDNLPQLYSHLCLMLNQDPINGTDPVINKSTNWLSRFVS